MEDRFAFIIHYPTLTTMLDVLEEDGSFIGKATALLMSLSFLRRHLKKLLLLLPPYQWLEVSRVGSSTNGRKIAGSIILCSFLPEHLVTVGEDVILNKLLRAGKLAERLGARLIGLAAFSSVVGNEGEELAKHLRVPVTSGNTYTAALVVEGIRKAAHLMGVNLGQSTLAIIGATGDIGSVCSRVFAEEVAQLNLAARNEPRLEQFARSLRGRARVVVKKYVRDAVQDAGIILTVTSAITTLIEAKDVQSGAIICDVAIPHNVASDIVKERPDIFAFEGGFARLPEPLMLGNPRWRRLSPDGITVFGCLAETMLLALEGRWEPFSIGRGHITPERLHEISEIASRQGFSLADFRYNGRVMGEEEIEEIRRNAKTRHTGEPLAPATRI